MQNSAAKRIAELRETFASCAVCMVRPSVLLVRLVRASVAAVALNFKILHAKLRAIQLQNCAISVPKVRAGRKRSAQTHSKGVCRRAMHSCAFRIAFAGAGRVSRAKIAPKFGDTFAISTENHG